MIVTIVGAGRLAEGIAVRALAGGCTLRLADAEPGRAEALAGLLDGRVEAVTDVAGLAGVLTGSDVVVLALPYPEGRLVAAQQGAAMAGLTLIDTCNPVDFSTFDALLTSPGMSAAEEIAREVATVSPAAHVVKAFSTTFAATLLTGQVAGLPLDVFLAGDDPSAKAKVAALVRAGGMRPVDTGPLRRSRELEALQLLHMTLQGPLGLDWASAVKLLPLHGLLVRRQRAPHHRAEVVEGVDAVLLARVARAEHRHQIVPAVAGNPAGAVDLPVGVAGAQR
jgi:predicted dinucleotide-binding enzyme